jgi:methyl-accepting chemotaxis protein
MKTTSTTEKEGGFKLAIKGKLILIFFLLALSVTGVLSLVSYISGSTAIANESNLKLGAVAEMKTKILENFFEDRFGEIHIMTGLNVLKHYSDELLEEIKESSINPGLSIEAKREYLRRNSSNYRHVYQFIEKYDKAMEYYSEIKLVAIFDIRNKTGGVVFREGDQIMSIGGFQGNVSKKTYYTGAMDLMLNRKEGVKTEKYNCPHLYTSSIEWCGELKKASIHMSHGLGKDGLNMDMLRKNTPLRSRFDFMLIYDINVDAIAHYLEDKTGMGESGETYLIQKIDNKIIMLSESRTEKGTTLKKDLTGVKGITEHINRREFRRGRDICKDVVYTNYHGEEVLAHNHMIKIGEHEIGVITEIREHEVHQAVYDLLMIMIGLGVAVLIGSAVIAILFSRTISNPIKENVTVAEAIAGGDLTVVISDTYKKRSDEIGTLSRALDRMSGDLNMLISNIIMSSRNLSQAVGEIASGNQNLSQRVSEQASSLEEIASTVEEANATTKQNSDNSQEANKLSGNTFTLAEDGGKVSEEAVEGINEISEVSKKIGDITTVINEISFQTNLLALNAAVEAARAGEAGRGFAVVAGEIRNLAQRSGNAAKEIETLITETIDKIDNGSGLVIKSGESLRGIIESIKQVRNIVEEITQASVEQKQGMDQISVAVTEMDTMTQQNAALVEETASASEEMANQAQELLDLTRRFKVDGSASDESQGRSVEIKGLHAAAGKREPEKAADTEPEPAVKDEKGDIGQAMKEEGFEEF